MEHNDGNADNARDVTRIPKSRIAGFRFVREAPFEVDAKWDRRRLCIPDPAACVAFLRPFVEREPVETFWLLALDTRSNVIGNGPVPLTRGTINQCTVHAREVFQTAYALGADEIVVAHNHPSGSPEPSEPDIRVSNMLALAGHIAGIRVRDSIVIGDYGRYTSLRATGQLNDGTSIFDDPNETKRRIADAVADAAIRGEVAQEFIRLGWTPPAGCDIVRNPLTTHDGVRYEDETETSPIILPKAA
jgi:DNA repair protein RadC